MDRLYQRYADPFSFMDGMMQTRRFSEFVDEICTVFNDDTEKDGERKMWELYLHRVFDKSFNEFMEEARVEQDNRNMSASEIETTILQSRKILANFNPEEGGE